MKGGIWVDNIGKSQKGHYIIKSINEIVKDHFNDIILFYNEFDNIMAVPKFAILQDSEVWGFDGLVIATSFNTAKKLISCPSPTKKFFYVWDLEWLNIENLNYVDFQNVYQNDSLDLIARSSYHAELLEKCWKQPVGIVEDFDAEQLRKILSGEIK